MGIDHIKQPGNTAKQPKPSDQGTLGGKLPQAPVKPQDGSPFGGPLPGSKR